MLKKYLRILLILLFSPMFLLLVYVAVGTPIKIGFGCYVSQNWNVIPAKIISAEVESLKYEDTNRRRKISYGPKVSYEYNYDGKIYVSNRYSWVKSYDNGKLHDAAKRLVYSKQKGKEIKIFVNPAKPSESVVERMCDSYTSNVYIFGGVFTLTIVSMFLAAFVFSRRKKQ
ncbi:DUF3592 domain-containing protein [Vibrio harveyi]|uniref:DUF3592 domain-containing protein n=2 Tax=Vibrio harveyi TaxID=669 RepID=UPI000577E919|nr:DUF3592 domain-containing protein [Vibrio harveyi]MBY7705126.1 DUF3592 domain-containing protein [Vibrio harveyi]PNM54842.1 DUF3592 domain-containing protein [Vibrio harveyi]PQJ36679.1 hypothetical protein BTN99_23625 [Vibrio campbellii]SQA34681.1 Protein of uncharacterised function (DUF3592) [Vibrio harveyi]